MASSIDFQFSFHDPVHGVVELPAYIQQLMNLPEYQRLRYLKQLGASYLHFASATHTRFEHGLGVCYLALKLLQALETNSKIKIDETHKKCVLIAGLYHDIGHGPFSHMWEQMVDPEAEWSHEQMSCQIIDHIFTKYPLELFDESKKCVELIKALVIGDLGVALEHLGPENMYLTEIVNNKFCNIDVDKWDYMLRDAFYLRGNFELRAFDNLFNNACVLKDEISRRTHISYHLNDFECIENIFINRANLHIYCYQEPTIRGLERLIIDTLKAADNSGFLLKGKKISELHEDPALYNFLDDSVLNIIRSCDDPRLGEAQNLLARLWNGDYYRLVWMSPSNYDLSSLTGKFGDYFIQIQKKIPLASVFVKPDIFLHDDTGHRVPVPPERIIKRNAYYEEYLIYSTKTDLEFLQAVSDFLTDIKAE